MWMNLSTFPPTTALAQYVSFLSSSWAWGGKWDVQSTHRESGKVREKLQKAWIGGRDMQRQYVGDRL